MLLIRISDFQLAAGSGLRLLQHPVDEEFIGDLQHWPVTKTTHPILMLDLIRSSFQSCTQTSFIDGSAEYQKDFFTYAISA